MKSISWTIWILGALLVMAMLDTRPDPPAVNPGADVSKVIQSHDCACDTAIRRCDSLAVSDSFPVSLFAVDTREPRRPSDRIVLTGQATDSSPPASDVTLN